MKIEISKTITAELNNSDIEFLSEIFSAASREIIRMRGTEEGERLRAIF